MTVYVDSAQIQYGRMRMSHLWADTLDELLAMADTIGVNRRWLQQPPKASWVHFDVCNTKRLKAIAAGAVPSDRFAAAEYVARLNGNQKMLDMIAKTRARRAA